MFITEENNTGIDGFGFFSWVRLWWVGGNEWNYININEHEEHEEEEEKEDLSRTALIVK